jgi:hypothetical protein
VAVYPIVVCSHSGKMMLIPDNPKYANPMTMVPMRKFRFANRCRVDHRMLVGQFPGIRKHRLISAGRRRDECTGELNQSLSLPLSSMNCRLPTPTTSRPEADAVDRQFHLGGFAMPQNAPARGGGEMHPPAD